MTLHQQSPSKSGWAGIPITPSHVVGHPREGKENRGETMCVPSQQIQQDKGP